MNIRRDPQNSIFDTIDNALRGAMRCAAPVDRKGAPSWTSAEQEFFLVATRMVMDALDISDTIPNGVWIVYSDDINRVVHSVHFEEVEAHRVVQRNGYFMAVKFVEFGDPDEKDRKGTDV